MTEAQVVQKKGYIIPRQGCDLWAGARDARGYGLIRRDGRTQRAHRYWYEQEVGPIPEGLEIHHLCENKACVNPAHLEPMPHLLNLQLGKEMQAWRNRMNRFVETGEWITAGAAASRRHRG